jgi:hypothetical protein
LLKKKINQLSSIPKEPRAMGNPKSSVIKILPFNHAFFVNDKDIMRENF